MLKIAGVWTTVDHPTHDQIEATTKITDPLGFQVPGAFLGGHEYPITATVQAELIAAGFGAYIT